MGVCVCDQLMSGCTLHSGKIVSLSCRDEFDAVLFKARLEKTYLSKAYYCYKSGWSSNLQFNIAERVQGQMVQLLGLGQQPFKQDLGVTLICRLGVLDVYMTGHFM